MSNQEVQVYHGNLLRGVEGGGADSVISSDLTLTRVYTGVVIIESETIFDEDSTIKKYTIQGGWKYEDHDQMKAALADVKSNVTLDCALEAAIDQIKQEIEGDSSGTTFLSDMVVVKQRYSAVDVTPDKPKPHHEEKAEHPNTGGLKDSHTYKGKLEYKVQFLGSKRRANAN